ncbi:MAG: hypothetical protein ACI9CA_001848 [Natronomonas sp.]|jgi:hypothetical protein
MTDADRFRDSTQILLPRSAMDEFDCALDERFTVTVREEDSQVRIIGSPVEIKNVSDFLARNGVTVA